jgi:hypothetical protein
VMVTEDVSEEVLDEEILECEQYYVNEGRDDGETLQIESLVEEIEDPVIVVKSE